MLRTTQRTRRGRGVVAFNMGEDSQAARAADECVRRPKGASFRPARSATAAPLGAQAQDGESRAFTLAATFVMSARPANWGLSAPITLPIAAGPATPVPAIAVSIRRSISASESG